MKIKKRILMEEEIVEFKNSKFLVLSLHGVITLIGNV